MRYSQLTKGKLYFRFKNEVCPFTRNVCNLSDNLKGLCPVKVKPDQYWDKFKNNQNLALKCPYLGVSLSQYELENKAIKEALKSEVILDQDVRPIVR